jgi:hypothetical protein
VSDQPVEFILGGPAVALPPLADKAEALERNARQIDRFQLDR